MESLTQLTERVRKIVISTDQVKCDIDHHLQAYGNGKQALDEVVGRIRNRSFYPPPAECVCPAGEIRHREVIMALTLKINNLEGEMRNVDNQQKQFSVMTVRQQNIIVLGLNQVEAEYTVISGALNQTMDTGPGTTVNMKQVLKNLQAMGIQVNSAIDEHTEGIRPYRGNHDAEFATTIFSQLQEVKVVITKELSVITTHLRDLTEDDGSATLATLRVSLGSYEKEKLRAVREGMTSLGQWQASCVSLAGDVRAELRRLSAGYGSRKDDEKKLADATAAAEVAAAKAASRKSQNLSTQNNSSSSLS